MTDMHHRVSKPQKKNIVFYAELEELIDRFKKTHIVMSLGGLNVRLQYRLESEKEVIV